MKEVKPDYWETEPDKDGHIEFVNNRIGVSNGHYKAGVFEQLLEQELKKVLNKRLGRER